MFFSAALLVFTTQSENLRNSQQTQGRQSQVSTSKQVKQIQHLCPTLSRQSPNICAHTSHFREMCAYFLSHIADFTRKTTKHLQLKSFTLSFYFAKLCKTIQLSEYSQSKGQKTAYNFDCQSIKTHKRKSSIHKRTEKTTDGTTAYKDITVHKLSHLPLFLHEIR